MTEAVAPLLERPTSYRSTVAEIRVLPRRPSLAQVSTLLGLSAVLGAGLWLRYRDHSRLPPPAPVADRPGPSRVLLSPPESRQPQLLLAAEEEALVWGIERFITEEPSERLDVSASVAATARHAGRPMLEFERARHHREVWLWCDDSADDPFLRRLAGEVQASLVAAGLVVERADFWGVPRRLVAAGGAEMELGELDERRDAAIVAVLTDGRLLALELESAERRGQCEALLRELSRWPRLAFVDFGDGLAASLLTPRKLETVAPSEAFAFLGGVRRPTHRQSTAGGDLLAWTAACALPAQAVDEITTHSLRRNLGLSVSPWGLCELFSERGQADRLSFDAAERARLLGWLLASECGDTGEIVDGSIFARALEFWDDRYAKEESARLDGEPAVPWEGTPAEQRLRLERALLRLWRQPEEATEDLYALFRAGHQDEVRTALRDLAPRDRMPEDEEEAVLLPWTTGDLRPTVQVMLREMGLGERWAVELPRQLRRPGRLWLALSLCVGAVAGGGLAVVALAFRPPAVGHVDASAPAQEVRVSRVRGTLRTWRVDVPGARSTAPVEVLGGSEVELGWQEGRRQRCTEAVGEIGELWRCGYLEPPVAADPDWSTRSVAFLEASPGDAAARELAAWLLDGGSVSETVIAPDRDLWDLEVAGSAILFSTSIQAEIRERQGLVRIRSNDWRRLAEALVFEDARPVAQVWPHFNPIGDPSIFVSGILNRAGAVRVNESDGSVLVHVPAGEYTLGADDLEELLAPELSAQDAAFFGDAAQPVHRVNLSSFWIAKHPVTNEQYRRYMMVNPPPQRPEHWDDDRFNQDLQPVVGVDWNEARAYCQWAGMELPTEAQWEAAARGTDQRRYPWGNQPPTDDLADFNQSISRGPAPVDSHPLGVGPFGTLEQAGNVWEWCFDIWDNEAYENRDGQPDPVVTEGDAGLRVLRGGSWNFPAWDLASAIRNWYQGSDRLQLVGFRCVLPVPAEPDS